MTDADLINHFAKRAGKLEGRLMFERIALRSMIEAIQRGRPEWAMQIAEKARERITRDLDAVNADRDALVSPTVDQLRVVCADLAVDAGRMAAVAGGAQ